VLAEGVRQDFTRLRGGRGLAPTALEDRGPSKLQRGNIVLEFRRSRDVEARAVLVSSNDELGGRTALEREHDKRLAASRCGPLAWKPEFGEGGPHRHCLTQRFDSGEANNCKSRKSDPQNGFHARTIALLACR
jgi:hypothetical protein